MASSSVDLNLIIHKTQALSWEDLSSQLEVDPVKAEQKALISLVGRLVSTKILFKPAVHEAFRSAWKFSFNLKIKDTGPNTFLFHFGSPEHKARILLQAPWNVIGFLLLLREWSPSDTLSSLDFSSYAFWVQIHGFPKERLSFRNALRLGSYWGDVVEVDPAVDNLDDCSDFMRVNGAITSS